jgi:hypothetical protein
LLLACAVVVASLESAAVGDDTQRYVVREGDSCISIAIRILGDRAALAELHRLNPQLGPSPHKLVAGTVLVLPAATPQGPDARLTRAVGDVKIRTPASAEWDVASRGADLYRAYRIGAASRSSAEMRFADEGLLGMRERTIVVIYGPEKRLAKTITATAELERGTLESRLGELDGKPIVVRTRSGEADLRAGQTVLTSNDNGTSVLSNHGGRPVALRGRTKSRTAVSVAAGMGTRVFAGKAPEPPRPLPPTPAWITSSGPRIASSQGTIAVAWGATERTARYRIAVRNPDGDLISASYVDAPTTSFELPLAPGAYRISVAALDADGLESLPASALELERIVPTFVTPSGHTPAAGAAIPRVVVVGTTIVAPAGMTCAASTGGSFEARLLLSTPGSATLQCADAARRTSEPVTVSVLDLAPSPDREDGEPVGISSSLFPPPSTPRHRAELGVYAGYQSVAVRSALALGTAGEPSATLDDGPTFGLRGGWLWSRFGVEGELAMSSLDRREVSGRASALGAGLHLTARHDDRRVSLRLLAGIHVTRLVHDAPDGNDSTVPGFSWGGAATINAGDFDIRVDLRHELAPGQDVTVAQAMQATIGAFMRFR